MVVAPNQVRADLSLQEPVVPVVGDWPDALLEARGARVCDAIETPIPAAGKTGHHADFEGQP